MKVDSASRGLLYLEGDGDTEGAGRGCVACFPIVDTDNAPCRMGILPGREIEPEIIRAAHPGHFAARDFLRVVVVIPIAQVIAVNNGNDLGGPALVMDFVLPDL